MTDREIEKLLRSVIWYRRNGYLLAAGLVLLKLCESGISVTSYDEGYRWSRDEFYRGSGEGE